MSDTKRSTWGSNATFILAAVGSAVGLGNAWRFPNLAAKHGGGAFLLVYLLAMLIIGIPLLMMEISIGRKMRSGAPGALRGLNKKFEPIGWAATSNAFVIVTYYAVVFAWVIMMAVFSFKFFDMTGNNEAASGLWATLIKTTGTIKGFDTVSVPVVICLLVAWGLIYYCIRNGTKSVDKIIKYLVFLPVICLAIMLIKGVTMEGAMAGLAKFFIPDFTALSDPMLWVDAIGQVFYSMSVMMAIMIAYGSFLNDDSNIARDGMIIAFSDLAVSLLSGAVMFTTMYGTGLEDVLAQKSGPGLAFGVYPTAIVNLSGSGVFNAIFAFIFYFCLCTLAIDSAFSLVEGISTAFSDKFGTDKKKTTITICVIAGIISLIYTTGAGLAVLDIVDNWCNSFTLILIGVVETIAIGWFFKTSKIVKEINRNTKKFKMPKVWFNLAVKVVAPVALSVLFIWNIVDLFVNKGGIYGAADGYNAVSNILAGWVVFGLCMLSGFIIARFKTKNASCEENKWDD
ncbi:MAG: sodium-dependent transporter [Clostridia bacterium]|nr:sodium-dependent transporter [Clostridia bacterium]